MNLINGKFFCRVKNYLLQDDSINKWAFSEAASFLHIYNSYGGNMLNAVKTQVSGRYVLTLNGESDHGKSDFKIILSSDLPISTGLYPTIDEGYGTSNRLDSMYFKSSTLTWHRTPTYLYSFYDSYPKDIFVSYCSIDTINSNKVVGTLSGKLRRYVTQSSGDITDIRKAWFKASF